MSDGHMAAQLTALVSSSRTNLRVYSHSECDVFSPLMALPLAAAAGTGAAGPAAPLGAATACAEPAAAPPCTLPFWLPPWALPSEAPRAPLPEKGVPLSAADAEVAELGRAVGVPHLRSRHSIAMPDMAEKKCGLAHTHRYCSPWCNPEPLLYPRRLASLRPKSTLAFTLLHRPVCQASHRTAAAKGHLPMQGSHPGPPP